MRFVALEEDGSFSGFLDFEDLAVIASRDVHRSSRVELDVPDVFCFGIEED